MRKIYDVNDTTRIKGKFGTNVTALRESAAAGAVTIKVQDATNLAASDILLINPGGVTEESVTISAVSGTTLTVGATHYVHEIYEVAFKLTDPTTITLKVKVPAGTITPYTYALSTVSKESTGIYYKDVELTSSGVWFYRWIATGTVVAAEEASLRVRVSDF